MPPGRFLSDAEIERLEGWPESIERRDLVRYCELGGEDLAFVRGQRGAANQLGIALQLCSMRWLGFVPEELPGAPEEVLTTLGASLDVAPRAIFDYAVRAPTRVEHRLLVRDHAGYRAFSERDLGALGGRFVDAALELYVNEIDAVCQAAAMIDGGSPGAILLAWLHRFYAYFTSKQLVAAELLEHSGADDPVFGTGYTRVIEAGRPLLLAARDSGEIQVDLTLEQILDMLVAIAKIPGTASYRAPILQAALQTLRTTQDA